MKNSHSVIKLGEFWESKYDIVIDKVSAQDKFRENIKKLAEMVEQDDSDLAVINSKIETIILEKE